jgi:hypothetical protein
MDGQIDAYFRGELNPLDRQELEARAATDPALRSELELQQAVVAGLGTARKAQLKEVLRNTPVEVPMGGSSGGANWYGWVAGGVALTALVGWLYFNPGSANDGGTGLPSSSAQISAPSAMPPANLNTEEPLAKEAVGEPKASSTTTPSAPKTSAAKEVGTDFATEALAAPTTTPVVEPDAAQPNVDAGSAGAAPESLTKAAGNDSPVDMVVKKDPAHTFHYQFFNSRLFLYGDFEGSIYEVLELKGKGTTQYYLFHKDHYYKVLPGTSEITSLEATTDKGTITSLERIRKK